MCNQQIEGWILIGFDYDDDGGGGGYDDYGDDDNAFFDIGPSCVCCNKSEGWLSPKLAAGVIKYKPFQV